MKKNAKMENMLSVVSQLSKEEQAALVEQIMTMMKETNIDDKNACYGMVSNATSDIPDCPHCAAKAALKQVIKSGSRSNGAPRFECKQCGKTFVATTGTAFAWTKKDADTWRKFIHLTISGATLHKCKDECGISYKAAFEWRHKILHVFELNQNDTNMSGNVEVDEMQIPISYKGNHIQGDFGARKKTAETVNDMPRKAYRRGSDNKSRHANDKACVFCMVQDGNKAFYAAVPGTGFMNDEMLDATVAKHVDKDAAVMLADDYHVTRKYFEKNGYEHVILKSNTSDNPKDHKVEVKDGLHIQHVNAMHHHIRQFLVPYCGVSSKYLSHYVSLFIWLKSVVSLHNSKAADEVSIARAAMSDCYISCDALRNRPAVPTCA